MLLTIAAHGQYSFHNYQQLTTAEGLPNKYASEVVEDKYGFIWIATSEGLARYDGSKLHTLEKMDGDSTFLQSNNITSLLINGDSLWIGTKKGLSIMNLDNGEISNIPLNSNYFPKETNASDHDRIDLIHDLYKDRQGNIWLAQTFGGFIKWVKETRSFQNFPVYPDPKIPKTYSQSNQTTIVEIIQDNDKDSIMWGATVAGIVKLNQETKEIKRILYQNEDGKKQFQVNRKICLYQATDGVIYSGSWTGGLSIYYPESGKYLYPPIPESLKGSHLFSILESAPDELYMNYFMGFYTFNIKNHNFRLIKENKSKGEKRELFGVNFIDSKQRAWFASSNNGVTITDPMVDQFRWYSVAASNNMKFPLLGRSFVEGFYPGQISISGQFADGIYNVDLNTGRVSKIDITSLSNENVKYQSWGVTILDANTLLITGSSKLYTYQKDTKKIKKYETQLPLQFSAIKHGVMDGHGIVWLGTNSDGLFSLNPQTKKIQSYHSKVPYPGVNGAFVDYAQNVWMLTRSGHLVFNRQENDFNIFDLKVDSTLTFLQGRNYCSCPNGEVWLSGEKEGLGLLSSNYPEKGILKKIQPRTIDGKKMPVSRVACSPKNDLWAISDDALIKIDRSDWTCQLFSFDYGLRQWSGVFQFLQSGMLLIGARDGFYTINPEKLKINKTPPIPYVSKITTKDGIKNRLEDHLNQTPVYLKPNEKVLTIEFSAINHTLAAKTKYQYQLEGIDEEWLDPGDRRALIYSYLPGGSYTFKLKAANNEEIWNDEEYKLPIIVGIPWYQTTIFKIGWWF